MRVEAPCRLSLIESVLYGAALDLKDPKDLTEALGVIITAELKYQENPNIETAFFNLLAQGLKEKLSSS